MNTFSPLPVWNQTSETQKAAPAHAHTHPRARTKTRVRKVGETFEGVTIAHLSAKLKMVIDPWNINGQQCFSLSCEGERGAAFCSEKENRKEKEL